MIIEADGITPRTVYCDGLPTILGCARTLSSPRWRPLVEGLKRDGWLVTHSIDFTGQPELPLLLLYFCPRCAQVVLRQKSP